MIQTATGNIGLATAGYVEVRIHPGVPQTLANAKENMRVAQESCGGVRRPLLVDISGCAPLDPEVRRQYSGAALEAFSRFALVVEVGPFGAMLGNVYLRVARPLIPTRIFTNASDAAAWLRSGA